MLKPPKPFERKIIASPKDYLPLSENCRVIGAFNPGVAKVKNENKGIEYWLLIRVAQAQIQDNPNKIKLPYFEIPNEENQKLEVKFDMYLKENIIKEYEKDVKIPDDSGGSCRMKHISLPMLLKLDEKGNVIERQKKPLIYPAYEYERFGMEDFRITDMTKTSLEEILNNSKNWIKGKLGYGQSLQGNYVLTYVIPHRKESVSTPFMITKDFKNFKRLPEGNTPRPSMVAVKDVIPFPEKVEFPHKTEAIRKNQKVYVGFTRPSGFDNVSKPGIWVSYSLDGILWGNPHRLTSEGEKTGSGTPPIKVNHRWLTAYHEITKTRDEIRYNGKLMSMDEKEPWKNCKTSGVLLKREDYRDILPKDGYTRNVVYPTGMTIHNGITTLFSGIDDTWTVMDKFYTEDTLKFLEKS